MSHTPGPWIAKQLDEEYLFPVVEINERNIIVNEGRSMEECRDNARLIAAAPELLAVIESALEGAAMGAPPNFREMAAVVKKARGE